MRKIFGAFIAIYILAQSSVALAADWNFYIHFSRQEDGIAATEFWYNNRVLWRLEFLPDGAQPVSGGAGPAVVSVAPDIVNGLFLLRVGR
ncbi:Hypothetical protein LUCI_3778 [Lucifera butyrica]|uniref:Uncharacterized protein n=1 Tax=Lucifera butyrica TaxID=1351585 RepID=A0A498RBZ2_9FIRM|nr:hypothetical protein [Lucifera butyrica]VBB08505.1 Hypothetical protein LUCI_3778 [Lucifera butyrica]